jgi:hypothetical protein
MERMSEHAHTLENPRRINGQQIRTREREKENFEARVEVELERGAEKVQRFEGSQSLQADWHDASHRERERRQRECKMEREEREREKEGVRMLEEAIQEGERAAEEDEDWIEGQSDLIGEAYARSMCSGDSKDDEVERLPEPRCFPIGVHPEARDYYGIEQEGEIWKDDGDKEMPAPQPYGWAGCAREVWERRDDMALDATEVGFTLDEGDTLTKKGMCVCVCVCSSSTRMHVYVYI